MKNSILEYNSNKALLFEGDCLEVMDKLIQLGVKVDAVICDPPYGTTACKWDSIIPLDKMWDRLWALSKETARIALFGAEPFSSNLRISQIKNFKYDWFWYKNCPTGIALAKYQPMRSIENISVFYKTNVGTFNKQKMASKITDRKLGKSNGKFGTKAKEGDSIHGLKRFIKKENPDNILLAEVNPRNVLEFDVVPRAKGTLHPTQKPIALMEYLVKTYTNEGDTVLDFCMGSGTTGVACKNLNRNFIGIEKDEKYFEIAKERLK